jgi:hypothetical protein
MPEALILAPVAADAAVGAGSLDAIITGAFVSSAGLQTAGTSIFASAAASFLGKAALSIGASFALNYAANALLRKSVPLQGTDYTIKSAVPARFIDVGRVKTGGALFWYESPNQFLFIGKILSCTRIQEIEQTWHNDTLSTFTGTIVGAVANVTNGPWQPGIAVEARLGAVGQSISTLLVGNFDEVAWPADFRLDGLPWSVTQYTQPPDKDTFLAAFPNGAPETTHVVKAAMVPDPRDPAQDLADEDTWAWSDNAANVILRFLVDPDGWGLDPDDIGVDSFKVAADDSDDDLPTTSGTEKRYRIWGRYTTAQDRSQVLRDMLEACDGRLLEGPDGKANLFVGIDRVPTVTLTSADFKSLHVEPFGDPLDRIGIAQPRMVLEAFGWREQAAPQVLLPGVDPAAQGEIDDMPLPYCPSLYQGQRLGKIRLHQRSPQWTITGVGFLSAMQSFGERYVRFVFDELGIDGIFEVAAFGLNLNDFTYPMKLQSVAAGMYSMTSGELKDLPPAPAPPSTAGLAAPAGIVAVYTDHDPADIHVSWTHQGFGVELQYRIKTLDDVTTGWIDATGSVVGDTADLSDLDEAEYQIRMRTRGTRSVGPWSDPPTDVTD